MKRLWPLGLVALAVVFIPQTGDYNLHVSNMFVYYAICALGLNILVGYTGQFSLAQAAFSGIGAYIATLAVIDLHLPHGVAMLVAGLSTGLFGVVLGLPTLRLSGGYLAIATIGFAETIRLVMLNWVKVTRGASGIRGIPAFRILGFEFSSLRSQFYLAMFLLVLCVWVYERIIHSHVGRVLMALRENEPAARCMGINSLYYKVLAFAASSFLCGIAGGLYAFSIRFISPDSFAFSESVTMLSMVVVGGIGTVPGAVIGAAILTFLAEWLRWLGDYRLLFFGLILVVMMLVMPDGVAGLANRFLGTRVRSRGARAISESD
ncbi:MAG: branched-chain amino acid ABC transporter permease [Bacillota bacterium]|nr:branched-chain amino acid ABC transporter permease [Bacillota bacterium]